MKSKLYLLCLLALPLAVGAQSKTTKNLENEYGEMFSAYFYKNTLRMLNQKEDKEFDEMIRNVEKMKFLVVDKSDKNFGDREYKKLTGAYRKESYEPIITSRMDGRNFDMFLKDGKGETPGTVVLVNDSSSLYILDIVGSIDMSKAGALFSVIDGSQDVSKMLKFFDEGDHRDDRGEKKKGLKKVN